MRRRRIHVSYEEEEVSLGDDAGIIGMYKITHTRTVCTYMTLETK
jgi:hypothetical protein